MNRSAALAPLSRDHQPALEAALRLRRADAFTVHDAVAGFTAFFERDGRRHFTIEEELLLPALPADDPEWTPIADRIRADHQAIREAARELADRAVRADLADAARELGTRLRDHVRFEERTAFGVLERRLAGERLDSLGRAVAAAEAAG